MLEFCLLALPWMADPATSRPAKPVLEPLLATCSRPAAMLIEPQSVTASPAIPNADTTTAIHWLKRWETATKNSPDRSRSARDELRRRVHESFNEHALAAVDQFVGPVKANRLNKNFEWRIAEDNRHDVCLEAMPRDETERLFYGALRVSLDTSNWNPLKLVVVGRNQLQRTVWQSEEGTTESNIQLVVFEKDVPPPPKSLVRTADAFVEER